MNEALVAQVEELGLSQKEARVYVANLMLGPATVQKIADFAGIKRVTAYVILESLLNLGLASQSNKGKKTYFMSEEPSNLKGLLEKKSQELNELEQNLEEILPQLQSLKSLPAESPSVKFYDSAEGIKAIMRQFINVGVGDGKTKMAYGISNVDQVKKYFPEFRERQANPERLNAGISSKIIYTSEDGRILKETDKDRNRESRYLPAEKYPLNADFTIVGNVIIMISLNGPKPLGVTIESADLAKGMLAIFNVCWDLAGRYRE